MIREKEYLFLSAMGFRQWLYVDNGGNPYFGKLSFAKSLHIGLTNFTLLGAVVNYFGKDKEEAEDFKFSTTIDTLNLESITIYVDHSFRDKIEIKKNGLTKKLWFENSGQSKDFALKLKEIFQDKLIIIP